MGVALGALLGTAVLAVALLLWRLSSGPISLGFLTPYLARALSAPDGSATVSIDATDLAWDRREGDVDLELRGVRILDADGDPRASFPVVSLDLSAPELLRGNVIPTAIDLDQPMLRLVVRPDGSIDFASSEGAPPEAESAAKPTAEGAAPTAVPPWLERLHGVRIRGGELDLVVPGEVTPFDLHRVDLALERDEDRFGLRYAGAIVRDAHEIDVSGDGHYELDRDSGDLSLSFAKLSPPVVAELIAELAAESKRSAAGVDAFFEAVRMPLSGRVRIALAERRPQRIELDVDGKAGKVVVPGLPTIDVTGVRLAAILDLALGQLGLLDLMVDLGGPQAHVVGTVADLAGEGAFSGSATLAALPVATLVRSWPRKAAPEARSWISRHITAGAVRRARIRFAGRLADPKTGQLALDPPRGSLAFQGLAVRFLDTMPLAQGVSGHGSFTVAGWRLVVLRQATMGGAAIRHAEVDIATPKLGATRIGVTAQVTGPLADVVSMLEREPVRLSRTLGFTPDVSAGTAQGKVGLQIALSGPASKRGPAVTAVARATGVELRRVVRDASFAGDLRFRLAERDARLRGSGRLADAPLQLGWDEPLGSTGVRRVAASGRVDDASRAALGLGAGHFVDGPVGFQAKWDQPRTGDGRVDLSLDLAEAAIEAAPLALKKPAGAPGTGAARLVVRAGEVVAIEDVAIQTPAAALHGSLTLAPGASVRTADLVTTLPRKTSSEPVRLTIAVRPEGGATRLTMSCDLASFWLEATQARSDWTGGRLDLDGRLKLDPGALRFDGHLDVRDVALKRSPVLAGILNLTSLSGVKNALTGKGGLRFDRVVSDLVWDGDQLQIRDGAATGPTIRILMDGTIDTAAESANLAGTLIPSYYGLNEAAPSIPVIGQIFGGSAKAAWTVEFKVTGPLADPKVSVNPLTSIAPGILRDVLKRLGG